ncbi:flagellar hook-length control protein [mine drainage metagenome]|uniref:Flagellar hook-length control protein n=1 Tax=mine drainage metagenome TaxID=410659 RepID=A0A1J5QH83_9ZZZZ
MKVGITSTVTESPELHRTDSGESSDPTMAFLAALGALVPGLVPNPPAVTGTGAAGKTATGTNGTGKVETGKSGSTPASAIPNSAKLAAAELETLVVAGQGGASEVGAKAVTAEMSAVLANVIAPTSIAPTSIAPTSIAPTSIAPTSIAPTSIANLLNAVATSDGVGSKIPDVQTLPKATAAPVSTDKVPLPTTPAPPVLVTVASSLPTKTTGKESETTSPSAIKAEPTLSAVVQSGLPAVTTAVAPTQSPSQHIPPNIANKVAPNIAAKNSSTASTLVPDAAEIATNEAVTPVVASAPNVAAGQARPAMDAKVAGANSTLSLSSGSTEVAQATNALAGRPGDHGHDGPTDTSKGQAGEQATSVPTNLAVPSTPARVEFAAAITTAAAQAARPQIADQLAPYVTALRHQPDGTHQITVVLHPAELGQVQVMVELRNGTVQLQLSGAHEAARAVLYDALPQLRRELTDAGLTVGSADVMSQDFGTGTGSAAGGNPGQNYQQGASSRDVPRDVGGLLRVPVVDSFASPVRSVVHAGVLDVNI